MPQKFPLNFRETARESEEVNRALEVKGEGIILAPSFIKDPQNYIGIPQFGRVISKKERHKGFQWEQTLREINNEGETLGGQLYMPTISNYMRHFLNALEAKNNKRILYDGRGNPIPKSDAENHFNYLSSGFEGGCWSWLDAYFAEGSGFDKLDLRQNHYIDASGKIVFQPIPLEVFLKEDVFVNLDGFNSQYLPVPAQKSPEQKYKQGENIRLWYPRQNRVAWVWADSVWADLSCDRDPSYRCDALGVFVCAEGARLKSLGGK